MPAGTCQAGRYAGMILLADWYPEQIPEMTEAIMPAGANCTETVSPPPLPAGAGAAGTSAEAGGGRAAGSNRDGVAAGASAAGASKKAKRSAFEDLCSSLGLASEEDSEDDVFESGKKVFTCGLARRSIYFERVALFFQMIRLYVLSSP